MILHDHLPVRVSRRGWLATLLLAVVALPGWSLVAVAQQGSSNPEAADVAVEPPLRPSADRIPAEDTSPAPSTLSAAPADDDPASERVISPDELADIRAEYPLDLPDTEPTSDTHFPPLAVPAIQDETPGRNIPEPRGAAEEALPHATNTVQEVPRPSNGAGAPPSLLQEQPAHVVETNSFTLTRTTYRVPPQMAERLVTFLSGSLSWPHLLKIESVDQQANDDGIQLIITASPDAQDVIGRLIGLMLASDVRKLELLPTRTTPGITPIPELTPNE